MPGQHHILYINGRTKRDAAKSPYIEGLKKDGYEVLYMIDPVDEYALQFIKERVRGTQSEIQCLGFGEKGGVLEKGSFQKVHLLENLEISRVSREPPDCAKQRRS